jgi:hypothetical protein
MRHEISGSPSVFALLLGASTAFADAQTNGPLGINIPNVGLDGSSIDIGQAEVNRPGDPDFDTDDSLYHTSVNPTQVYWRMPGMPTTFNASNGSNATTEVRNHPIAVAGILISTDATLKGVSPGANLYSIGDNATGPNYDPQTAETIQYLITRPNTDMRVVNMSLLNPPIVLNYPNNGSALLTQFVDWSASANSKDILYVVSGFTVPALVTNIIPSDNFNGMTIAYSEKVGDSWRKVGSRNNFSRDAAGPRTSISLLAPGDQYSVAQGGSTSIPIPEAGTSYAVPQVTGSAALLQQFALNQINASTPGWDADARRHQVMKAVLLNSADKIEDTGNGQFLGMERTVLKQDSVSDWRDSNAFSDPAIPLDIEMGAGHLNVKRALAQFSPGETPIGDFADATVNVAQIGWDFNNTTFSNFNKYSIQGNLTMGNYFSVTLAWDRIIGLNDDWDGDGEFDRADGTNPDDTFVTVAFDNLDLHIVPAGTIDLETATWKSSSTAGLDESSVEHIFDQIPSNGQYEIWVQNSNPPLVLGHTRWRG